MNEMLQKEIQKNENSSWTSHRIIHNTRVFICVQWNFTLVPKLTEFMRKQNPWTLGSMAVVVVVMMVVSDLVQSKAPQERVTSSVYASSNSSEYGTYKEARTATTSQEGIVVWTISMMMVVVMVMTHICSSLN